MADHNWLHQLADLYGIEVPHSADGAKDSEAREASLLALLRSLGAPIDAVSEAEEAVRQRRDEMTRRVMEPVIVAWDDEAPWVSVHLPVGSTERWSYVLTLEHGDERRNTGSVADLLQSGPDEGTGFVPRALILGDPLPHGYHVFDLTIGSRRHAATIIAAPRRAFVPEAADACRSWGLFAPIYALHSERGAGIGDLADLAELGNWAGGHGADFIGTLPLLATDSDRTGAGSPYTPVSRRFWNEIYLALDWIPELERSSEARALMASAAFRDEVAALHAETLVDAGRVMVLKKRVLTKLVEAIFADASPRREALEEHAAAHPLLDEYARFRAGGTAADIDQTERRYHLYVQWLMHEQLRKVSQGSIGLYLDLPLGVHPKGFDAWRERDLFLSGATVGAPPDALSMTGQDWGFAGPDPEASRRQGHRYFAECVRHHMSAASMLRIDHVMGLQRLFLIPDGMSARDGLYVRYAPNELYAVLSIESQRSGCMIVGEDLGTVPPQVRPAMAEHAVHRMYVGQFEMDTEPLAAMRDVLPYTVATFGTHDTATFAGYWQGRDIDDQVALGGISSDDRDAMRRRRDDLRHALGRFLRHEGHSEGDDLQALFAGCTRHLAAGRAAALMVNLEDLWLEEDPQNVPGTTTERPNWRRRARYGMEQLDGLNDAASLLRDVDALRRGEHLSRDAGGGSAKRPPRRRKAKKLVSKRGRGVVPGSRITDEDVYLFKEGTQAKLHAMLGSHPERVGGVDGSWFAVWAPDAERVSVIGNFNGWYPEATPLAPRGDSGIWEAFVPGAGYGALYKYRVQSRYGGHVADKTDPVGQFHEVSPRTASRVYESEYDWGDEQWMRGRGEHNRRDAPISIYEIHLGSWRRVPGEENRSLSYRELAPLLADYVAETGFTHVEFMPVMEHPFYGSWGYQVTGYFAPTSRFGTPDDLRFLIDTLHQRGIGVILDWVPAHFPTDEHGLGFFDGTHLYEHADPRRGFHPDWKSFIFNYGRNEVRSFLLSSALFWLDAFHADGLRVDGVASMLYLDYSRAAGEWIPNAQGGRENLEAISLVKQINAAAYAEFPDTQIIAEESTAWPMVSRPVYDGGLGFGFKWDMGWMHDTLSYMQRDPIHRGHHQHELTFRGVYAFSESFVLPLSHDEVVHGKGSLLGKMPGDDWQKHANLRALFAMMYAQPGKKLIFMGGEIGQWAEWNHDASVEWHLLELAPHAGVQRLVGDLNRLYRSEKALHERDSDPAGFEWIDTLDAEKSVLTFLRRAASVDETVVVACNLTPVPRYDYEIGVPNAGRWSELLNTDAESYGGSGIGNQGGVDATDASRHGRPHSVRLTLPPLSVIYLRSA